MAAVPRVQKKAQDAPSWEPLDTAARDRAPVLCMGYTLSMTESSLLCFKELCLIEKTKIKELKPQPGGGD